MKNRDQKKGEIWDLSQKQQWLFLDSSCIKFVRLSPCASEQALFQTGNKWHSIISKFILVIALSLHTAIFACTSWCSATASQKGTRIKARNYDMLVVSCRL